jgi:methanethiol oxidase
MALWKPDPTFYPSPRLAMEGPREDLAYVVTFNPNADVDRRPDALSVLDLDQSSSTYGQVISRLAMPEPGDQLHHFGWNACSSALCPYAPHAHVERRYLVVPGLSSSRLNVIDTKPDPREPRLVRTISADELARRSGYSRPHTIHCAPDGIYVSALGAPDGSGPGGIFVLDHDTFDVLGRWEVERGPQYLAYDFWWHLGYDTMFTSEWGTPNMIEAGLDPSLLLGNKYGKSLHVWDLRKRRHVQQLDLDEGEQLVLELRPAHDPTKAYGFVGVVVSTKTLAASIWVWHRAGSNGKWAISKAIEIPAEPADASLLPPALKPFGAVPPLVSDINLSLDDRYLYVSCWGTGELRQYDVSDPMNAKHVGSVRLGGIVQHAPHPANGALNGGPQMLEVSRDGQRIYVSNSLYRSWDEQFYPEGIRGWIAKLDVNPSGGIAVDPEFFVEFQGERPHQIRLAGGDASSDSYCYP